MYGSQEPELVFLEAGRRGRHFHYRPSAEPLRDGRRAPSASQHRGEQSPGGARFWGDGRKKTPLSVALAWEAVQCVLLKYLGRLWLLSWAPVPRERWEEQHPPFLQGWAGGCPWLPALGAPGCGCSDRPSSSWACFNGEPLSFQ